MALAAKDEHNPLLVSDRIDFRVLSGIEVQMKRAAVSLKGLLPPRHEDAGFL